MSKKLKPCSICGSPAERVWDPEEELVKCSNEAASCHNAIYPMYLKEWQRRTIEDALEARIAELKAKLDNWQDCYCEYETIAPDGTLKISVLDLYNRLTEREARVAELEAENAELKDRVARLKAKNKRLKARANAAAQKSTYWDHQNCKCSVVYKQAEEGEK